MAKIMPAILAASFEELAYSLKRLTSFAEHLHIDVADGEFVSQKTVGPQILREIAPTVKMEIHLMVKNPLDWVSYYQIEGVEQLIFHYECFDDIKEVIDEVRHQGLIPSLAINPETSIEKVAPYLEKVESAQVMTIHPGQQGSELMIETLTKIDELKNKFPGLPVSVDGGANLETLTSILKHPVDSIVVGSAIVKADNPEQAYEALIRLANDPHL